MKVLSVRLVGAGNAGLGIDKRAATLIEGIAARMVIPQLGSPHRTLLCWPRIEGITFRGNSGRGSVVVVS